MAISWSKASMSTYSTLSFYSNLLDEIGVKRVPNRLRLPSYSSRGRGKEQQQQQVPRHQLRLHRGNRNGTTKKMEKCRRFRCWEWSESPLLGSKWGRIICGRIRLCLEVDIYHPIILQTSFPEEILPVGGAFSTELPRWFYEHVKDSPAESRCEVRSRCWNIFGWSWKHQ